MKFCFYGTEKLFYENSSDLIRKMMKRTSDVDIKQFLKNFKKRARALNHSIDITSYDAFIASLKANGYIKS